MELNGKTVWITGASFGISGIGCGLVQKGCSLIFISKEEQLQEVAGRVPHSY